MGDGVKMVNYSFQKPPEAAASLQRLPDLTVSLDYAFCSAEWSWGDTSLPGRGVTSTCDALRSDSYEGPV